MARGNQHRWVRNAGLASSAGLVLVISTILGYEAGSWLDGRFGTSPWLMLVLTLMGITAGFIELFRLVLQILKDEEDQQ